MRTLAIDHGGKRVGLAMSDPGGRFATPLDVLPNDPHLLGAIAKIMTAEDVQRVVVGLPLNMDGTLGPSAKPVLAFAKQLQSLTGTMPLFVDERLSSFDAEQQLIDQKRSGQKMTRQMKKERLDAMAAASFLRAFLDGQLSAIDPATVGR
jgi:putative holliday junction resolvase